MKTSKFFLSTFIAAAAMTSTAYANLYVSSDYNSATEGYGVTKFSNYASAYAYAVNNNKKETIIVEKVSVLSGNTFDNNHKNYSNLAVVVKDGALMGNALSKWDMTYAVTVEAGGKLEMARPKNSSVSNVHLKNTLTIGAEGASKRATLNFLSDTYQDGDISIRPGSKLIAYNADIYVQDLDARGTMSLTNSDVYVDGALCTATLYKATLTNTDITVKGKQITGGGGITDFAEENYDNRLGTVTMTNSSVTFNSGSVNIGGTVKVENGSSLTAENLVVSTSKFSITDSTLSATAIANNGTITFSGNSELLSGEISGSGKVVISSGATLTVAASSLLANANITNNGGTIIYGTIDGTEDGNGGVELSGTADTAASVTVGSKDNQVVLSSNARITVKKAEEIDISAEGVDVPEGALAAWSFDIDNNDEAVTVTMNVGTGLSLDTIRIMHKGDNDIAWKDFTDTVTNKSYDASTGTLTFTTRSFSDYSAVKASSVPEPSAFGLLAGLGALALVAARRRRK